LNKPDQRIWLALTKDFINQRNDHEKSTADDGRLASVGFL
jgi:hypothetical protein